MLFSMVDGLGEPYATGMNSATREDAVNDYAELHADGIDNLKDKKQFLKMSVEDKQIHLSDIGVYIKEHEEPLEDEEYNLDWSDDDESLLKVEHDEDDEEIY